MIQQINSFYDVQQLLKKFGFIVYFKEKNDMYEMMEQEIKSLFNFGLISKDEYIKCRLIINQRRTDN
ncbi:YqgQ family protein [Staphylococcus caeli]|uniref:YqgQ family protein n=1 Tax=Staphylococcus caeli TaxID=2201815 RepID=UPI003F56771A